eukprot:jgi/Psemu1/53534/gm1.53534_g
MDAYVEKFYRELYGDRKVDVDEATRLSDYFTKLNPPPDKLLWLRSTAFRIACEFLSEDKDQNVALLKCINYIVHALESLCMVPALPEGNSGYDGEQAQDYFQGIFSDLTVDQHENSGLRSYFEANIPPSDSLVAMRATAFKAAIHCLSEDGTGSNISLLRCVNSVVHNFELVCYKPKEYVLQKEFNLDVNLSDAVQEMWNLDVNRLTPNVDYTIDVQQGKKPYWKEDAADDPLFVSVDRDAIGRPTYRAFIALLDNYKSQTGNRETTTSREEKEIDAFLHAILQTGPMQYCHKYLRAKKGSEIPSSLSGFQKHLHDMWFDLYRRQQANDSSGFEHVFVGEVKSGKVSGMHNWIQIYLQEKAGSLDYRGYIKPRGRSSASTNFDDHLLTIQFHWEGVEKAVGTSLIGTSPEFEMALYTTCFLMGEEDNEVSLDTGTGDVFDLNIRCYSFHGDKIGTAFPEISAHYD